MSVDQDDVNHQVNELVDKLSKVFIARLPGRNIFHVMFHYDHGPWATLCPTSHAMYRKTELHEWQTQSDVLCEQCLIYLSGLWSPGYRRRFLTQFGVSQPVSYDLRHCRNWARVKPYFNCR